MKLLCAFYRTGFLKTIFQKDIHSVMAILAAVLENCCYASLALFFAGSGGLPLQLIL